MFLSSTVHSEVVKGRTMVIDMAGVPEFGRPSQVLVRKVQVSARVRLSLLVSERRTGLGPQVTIFLRPPASAGTVTVTSALCPGLTESRFLLSRLSGVGMRVFPSDQDCMSVRELNE